MRERNARLHRILALSFGAVVLAVGSVVAIQLWQGGNTVSEALADKDEVCICHATGKAGTDHFVTVCASRNAIFGKAGHFGENGTPNAGHEEDRLGPCTGASPSPSPGTN
jgi:hypothetical protein